ncbi:hypothetical protein [Antarcticimicrobium luteum]|uniref:Uncharacterized protein n=1 Tax=Antarcticimicrobium luteum TaxID=2547397 RepID=A0A4R5UVS3_9RHOB|nr:hypothetical protein [Antarcticimicrobium luteum]TDK43185.1 hypothetical protein E1832_18220 [Antarcticimicrobium luteum]
MISDFFEKSAGFARFLVPGAGACLPSLLRNRAKMFDLYKMERKLPVPFSPLSVVRTGNPGVNEAFGGVTAGVEKYRGV